MDDERLKDMRKIDSDFFDELLEQIRDMRASERPFYHLADRRVKLDMKIMKARWPGTHQLYHIVEFQSN